jgi:hypothetical protein
VTGPLRKPQPSDWPRAYAQVQVATDQEILVILADAAAEVQAEIARIVSKRSLTINDEVRHQQMLTVRKALLEQQSSVLRALGRVVEARRLDAVARAIKLGNAMDAYVLDKLGRSALARDVLNNLTVGLARTTEVALARMGYSYTELAQNIYDVDVWLGSRVDQRITSMLAQGLSAKDFAAKAQDWFNPNTPGGVRYAALRLARSEINNAFHAVAVQQVQDKPWVHAMQWHLSGSHPKADLCDEYANEDKFDMGAGIWPKGEVPRKPHPHCYCYVTGVQNSEEDFLDALVRGDYDKWIEQERATANATQPSVPTPRSVSGSTRARTAPPSSASRPSPATTSTRANSGSLTRTEFDAAKAMYGDFTKNVRLLDAMRVPDLKRLAAWYGLPGAASQTRPVLLRRLKAKISRV